MENFLETKGLAVGYDGKAIIHDITLSLERGEVVTLIGPNGSGKSTILKTITKHLATVSGAVWIGRDELGRLSYRELSKRVAVVLTDRIKPELMTCRDVVATGRYPYTGLMGVLTPEDEDAIDAAMLSVNVLELSNRSYEAISDGQRQRVLLARAICQDPEMIILDEPTSFLDIRHKVELLSMLRRMAQEKGTMVLLSLHEIDLAQKMSDRVICVHGDRIARFGTPDEVFEDSFIRELYELEPGTFNVRFGSIELPRPDGEPRVFVISACGSGTTTYRALQRRGIPFAAGILYENDIDRPVAESLAAALVTETPFEPISDAAMEKAMEIMTKCRYVIVCDTPVGTTNARIRELIAAAGDRLMTLEELPDE